ncbi:hypothetical protein B0181_04820 [Moraxella caviae]|uniref:Uncharacterized protein n=1 Tax=Moraxella caviae TaxID=34060 RepID=A0A1T0A4F6_9GAMM|nr:hypothetical protein [Moraxella caviae]OOR90201.1 hypothetical protein B0181_04820 [Moraxella caviae]STZ14581.1 Uncharacterised protein [Moraxella caviae]
MSAISRNDAAQIAEIKAIAEKRTKLESTHLIAAARLGHHIGCHNTLQPVRHSEVAGTVMPDKIVQGSAIALGKAPNGTTFIAFLLQENLWDMIKPLKPKIAILEGRNQHLAIQMYEVIAGDYKLNPYILSFPIRSNELWEKLTSGKISFFTLGLGEKRIEIAQDGTDQEVMVCTAIQEVCAPILKQSQIVGKKGMSVGGF